MDNESRVINSYILNSDSLDAVQNILDYNAFIEDNRFPYRVRRMIGHMRHTVRHLTARNVDPNVIDAGLIRILESAIAEMESVEDRILRAIDDYDSIIGGLEDIRLRECYDDDDLTVVFNAGLPTDSNHN